MIGAARAVMLRRSDEGWPELNSLVRLGSATIPNLHRGQATWHPDGTRMYTTYNVNTSNRGVQSLQVNTPFDLNTVEPVTGRVRNHLGLVPFGLVFSSDGQQLMVAESSRVRQYTLSTPWDISTATETGSLSVTSLQAFNVTPDGRNLYVTTSSSPLRPLQFYKLPTPWDLTTATLVESNIDLLGGTTLYPLISVGAGGEIATIAQRSGTAQVLEGTLSPRNDIRTFDETGGTGTEPVNYVLSRSADGRHLFVGDVGSGRLSHYGAHPGFTGFTDPTSLFGLRLWLDAADANTITTNKPPYLGREGVISWVDKSPHGVEFKPPGTNTGSTVRPYIDTQQNGLNVLRFDGEQYVRGGSPADWKFLHDGTPYTLFAVTNRASNGNSIFMGTATHDPADGPGFDVTNNSEGRTDVIINGVSDYAVRSYEPSVANPLDFRVLTLAVAPDNPLPNHIIRRHLHQGGNRTTGTGVVMQAGTLGYASNPQWPLTIGRAGESGSMYSGEVAEIIIYDRKLIPEEITAVENYLITKWGV